MRWVKAMEGRRRVGREGESRDGGRQDGQN